MLSKKRVRTKLNTRTKLRKLSNKKKRVKRVSTKQRGGVKRRRTKKSKKKSQKGGNGQVAIESLFYDGKIDDPQKKILQEILSIDPTFLNDIVNALKKLNKDGDRQQFDKVLQFIDNLNIFGFNVTNGGEGKTIPRYEKEAFTSIIGSEFPLEKGTCKGLVETNDLECNKLQEQESCIEPKPYSRGGTPLGTKQKCKWTPADN